MQIDPINFTAHLRMANSMELIKNCSQAYNWISRADSLAPNHHQAQNSSNILSWDTNELASRDKKYGEALSFG